MKDEKMKAPREKAGENLPRHLTSLSGETLVPKIHGRIVFRGIIDTLEAEVIEAQVLASQSGEPGICRSLGEILDYLRLLMAAEVKGTPLPPPFLFGRDAEEIHRLSHQPLAPNDGGKTVPLPDYTQGPVAARLNTLRAKVREAELLAVKVFGSPEAEEPAEEPAEKPTEESRDDIILALNRLSSALWWLYCESRTVLSTPTPGQFPPGQECKRPLSKPPRRA